jgi:hypothetical protein
MLRASLAYTGKGAIVGLAVLFSGLIFILFDYLRLSRKGRSQ